MTWALYSFNLVLYWSACANQFFLQESSERQKLSHVKKLNKSKLADERGNYSQPLREEVDSRMILSNNYVY